jgi:hypothetical protein
VTDGSLQDKLTDLQVALGDSPPGQLPLPKLEDLKAWLDDSRLQVWGRLQATQTEDQPPLEDRFRVRRATELCQRLAADIGAGRIAMGRLELTELEAVATELVHAIATRP